LPSLLGEGFARAPAPAIDSRMGQTGQGAGEEERWLRA
jgi:hypothetical protein